MHKIHPLLILIISEPNSRLFKGQMASQDTISLSSRSTPPASLVLVFFIITPYNEGTLFSVIVPDFLSLLSRTLPLQFGFFWGGKWLSIYFQMEVACHFWPTYHSFCGLGSPYYCWFPNQKRVQEFHLKQVQTFLVAPPAKPNGEFVRRTLAGWREGLPACP